MNRIAIATSLAGSLIACTQEADIGINSQPVSCVGVGTAEVAGSVTNGAGNTVLEFETVTPRMQLSSANSTPYTAVLEDGQLQLRLGFLCGAAERTTYGVEPVGQQTLDCPYQVTGSVLAPNEFVDATTGTLIVDETQDCLAGRFAIDFGDQGSLDGWFSAPWQ